ncbi:inositol polyphosphate 5-phosphatase OCRL-like [Mytilus californianus]|uniref:inositol polyphosphate 5-phosphatase OCRL-like n=1 Tax=Mytilus californianus TaxID=6549 RepID=UPI002245B015|nr:inositol polyphosphate 5-phosphatase OCRL-like [Mytilus californianus]
MSMSTKQIEEKFLSKEEKCIICINGKMLDTFSHAPVQLYIALVARQDDHGLFIFSVNKFPNPSIDDLDIDKVVPVDADLRTVSEVPDISQQKEFFVLHLKSKFINAQLVLPDHTSTAAFLEELSRAQSVYSNIVAFGNPPSFAWLENYNRQNDNPFAKDVFDPFVKNNQVKKAEALTKPHSLPVAPPRRMRAVIIRNGQSLPPPVPERPRNMKEPMSQRITDLSELDPLRKTASKQSLDELDLDDFTGSSEFPDVQKMLGLGSSEFSTESGGKPVTARETIVKHMMNDREVEFTDISKLKIFVGTWNTNGQSPPISIAQWLQVDPEPPDIYAIGFQELDLSNQAHIFSDSPKESEWQHAVKNCLHPKGRYRKVKLVRLVGVMLIVYVLEKHSSKVHFIDSDTVATGIMGIMGNKGGVGVRFTIESTSICFLCSHLAAHQDELERRNQDYRDISSKMRFKQFVPPLTIDEHELVFWLGDLNYRLNDLDIDKVKTMIQNSKLQDLMSYDQLHRQLGRTDVFKGYSEAEIKFKPTYKYDINSDDWDSSEKSRPPAWCDRILYKGGGITSLKYRYHPELKISDHKPVSDLFDVEVRVVDKEKSRKVYEDIMKQLDRLENDYLPQVKLDKTEIILNDVKFIETKEDILTITNSGQVPVNFEFIQKLDEPSYCKPWMMASPSKAVITPGKNCEINISVFVDKKSAAVLNSGEDKLEDILVLHLNGGKDFFISVSGNYIASSFGSSLEALIQMHGPVREIPTAQLVEIEQPGSLVKRDVLNQGGRLYAIPKEIWRLVDHLWQYGCDQEDLFQQPGLNKEIQLIRDCLDTGAPEKIPGSIHSIAEGLLLFLESLPDPVIPKSVHKRCLECSNNYLLCKQIIMQIPEYHRNVFRYLCSFLKELLSKSQNNNLDIKFLASLFGDVFLRPDHHYVPTSSRANKNVRSVAKEEEMKRAAFVYHFLSNNIDDV